MKTFIDTLVSIYQNRNAKKKSYSVRAFARDCKVSVSRMSDYLNKNRSMSAKQAGTILQNLNMRDTEMELLTASYAYTYSRQKSIRRIVGNEFKSLAHPVYFAFLSQLEADKEHQTEKDLSHSLGLDSKQFAEVKSGLIKMGLVLEENGLLKLSQDRVETTFDFSSQDIRNAHKTSLMRVVESIDDVDVSRRDVTRYTVITDSKKIAEAKKKIQTFSRKLCSFLESGKKNEVYELSIQLFPWKIESEI